MPKVHLFIIKRILSYKLLFFVLFFSLSPLVFLFTQNLDDAYQLELSGKNSEALLIYMKWLDTKTEDSLYIETLLHASSLINDIDETLSFFKRYEKRIRNKNNLDIVKFRKAQILELSGYYREAFQLYKQLYENLKNNKSLVAARYFQLCLSSGDYQFTNELELYLDKVPVVNESYVELYLLYIRGMFFGGNREKSLNLLVSDKVSRRLNQYSVYYYSLWELYSISGMNSRKEDMRKVLTAKFPDSIETLIVNGVIEPISDPAVLINSQ